MASKPDPAERASEIINAAPSSSGLVTKTGSILLGTGLTAAAISQELYVVNEETLIAVAFFIIVGAIGRVCVFYCCKMGGYMMF
jgi:F-type H+-transporting ATPase subunit b